MKKILKTEKIFYPVGGLGAGNFFVDGSGRISCFSIGHKPKLYDTPSLFEKVIRKDIFASVVLKDMPESFKVIEGQVNKEKLYYDNQYGVGVQHTNLGLPRFENSTFEEQFPTARVTMWEKDYPLVCCAEFTSPFIPTNSFDSSLPIAFINYTLENTTEKKISGVFYFSAMNFLAFDEKASVTKNNNGFIVGQKANDDYEFKTGYVSIQVENDNANINTALFRGGWCDPLSMLVRDMQEGTCQEKKLKDGAENSPGGSIAIPFSLNPNEKISYPLIISWFVPFSTLKIDDTFNVSFHDEKLPIKNYKKEDYYRPWYSSQFKSILDISNYAIENKDRLLADTACFSNAFYNQKLPKEIIQSVATNLTILKSPTLLRQYDGKLWGWEGSGEDRGSCPGSCDHVYNYATALAHLFPDLERTLRETNYNFNQTEDGRQTFRALIPIRKIEKHTFFPACDGMLGNIIKLYRDFIICGDISFLEKYYSRAKQSLDFSIEEWDPNELGALLEPHHNTFDIEFFGADGMCTSFYLGALTAFIEICKILKKPFDKYQMLANKSLQYMEKEMYNGEYFRQIFQWDKINAEPNELPVLAEINGIVSEDTHEMVKNYGPKYQYGEGCLSDGIIGEYVSQFSFINTSLDSKMIQSNLNAIYKNNFKSSHINHVNPQRATYLYNKEGGLLCCTWKEGERPMLPFPYSDEVWTGVEYQVASHMLSHGLITQALEILKTTRKRYNGEHRNPFNEIECGNWYIRALSSYSLLEGYTGVRFDGYSKTLYVRPKHNKKFTSFLSTNTGYGEVIFDGKKATLNVLYGNIPVEKIIVEVEK